MSASAPRILVCDDTPAKRYVLSSWLRRAGFEVIETETVAGAVTLLHAGGIDLAVLDVHLPDGSGLDVTRRIRSDSVISATPVIHVSAVAIEAADQVVALDEGADAYLVDPIDPEILLSTVRAQLRSLGARRQAETMATRLARLNRAALRLNVAASIPRLVEATAGAAADIFDRPALAFLVDEQGEAWRASVLNSDRSGAAGLVAVETAGELLRLSGTGAHRLDSLPAWAEHLPTAGGAWTGHPVRAAGRVIGVVAAQEADEAEDAAATPLLLGRLAQAAAVAADNIQTLAFEHRTARTLQRSLLPQALPEPPDLRLAARYRASQQRVEVGGDFYDAFEIDDRCFLVIGDVQGHSLEAAVVMAELRYSLRAYAYEGHTPETIADLLDELLVRTGTELIATVCIGLVDRDRRRISVVTGGHPPPLLVRSGSGGSIAAKGTLLGAGMSGHRAYAQDLEPGDRLVFFTDGLVERRGQNLIHNIERFTLDAARAEGSGEAVADTLLGLWGDSDDDVALLVVDVG